MFDKNKKLLVKRIHLVTDDGLYDRKAFYTVKIVFYSSSMKNVYFILTLIRLDFLRVVFSKGVGFIF